MLGFEDRWNLSDLHSQDEHVILLGSSWSPVSWQKLPSCPEVLDFVACLMRPFFFVFVFVILRSFHPIELVQFACEAILLSLVSLSPNLQRMGAQR
jgi:hypothetical protein